MRKHNPFFTLLLIASAAWFEAIAVRAASPRAVAMWGAGGAPVPVAAESGVIAVAAGGDTVALKDDGSVIAWGSGYSETGTVVFPPGSGVTAIATGDEHALALKSDGSVVAWGNNSSEGQQDVPAAARSGVIAIAAGALHSVALRSDGSVVAWGDNSDGQTTVPAAAQSGAIAIAGGGVHTVALKNDGSVVAWGGNYSGQTTVPVAAQSGVIAIAAGYANTLALKSDGSVVIWGTDNYHGQTNVPVAAQSGVVAIAAGYSHFLVLKNDGTVVAWGNNEQGQVTGTPSDMGPYGAAASPVTLEGQVLRGVTAISGGSLVSVAIVTPAPPAIVVQPVSQSVNAWQSPTFTVTAMGFPLHYQWRKGGVDLPGATSRTCSLSLVQTNHAGTYTVVVSNSFGSITSAPAVLTVEPALVGTVVPWGKNWGQMNVPASAQSGVTAVAAGDRHVTALKSDGSVVAWGDNCCGQTALPAAAQSGVIAIDGGAYHTVALKNDGSVVAWGGRNNTGSGSWPDYDQSDVPATAMSGVIAISAGAFHTMILKNDGSVVVWGAGYHGQTNMPAAAQSGVIAIAAGEENTAALKTDGTLLVWGDYGYGQANVPAGLNGVVAISVGSAYTVALVGTAPPSLNAKPGGNQLLLSWPTNAAGFTLQSTLDLTPPATWTDVTPAPVLLGRDWTVTNSLSGSARFYRLRKP